MERTNGNGRRGFAPRWLPVAGLALLAVVLLPGSASAGGRWGFNFHYGFHTPGYYYPSVPAYTPPPVPYCPAPVTVHVPVAVWVPGYYRGCGWATWQPGGCRVWVPGHYERRGGPVRQPPAYGVRY